MGYSDGSGNTYPFSIAIFTLPCIPSPLFLTLFLTLLPPSSPSSLFLVSYPVPSPLTLIPHPCFCPLPRLPQVLFLTLTLIPHPCFCPLPRLPQVLETAHVKVSDIESGTTHSMKEENSKGRLLFTVIYPCCTTCFATWVLVIYPSCTEHECHHTLITSTYTYL